MVKYQLSGSPVKGSQDISDEKTSAKDRNGTENKD